MLLPFENDDTETVITYKNKDDLRIMNYNVHGFKNREFCERYGDIIGMIKKIDPDVLVVEEVFVCKRNEYINQDKLVQDLGMIGFANFYFSSNGANLICTKTKSLEFESHEINFGPDPIKGTHRHAIIINFIEYPNLVVAGTHLDVFDESGKTRKKQIRTLLKYLNETFDDNTQIIISGDFNSLRRDDYTDQEWNDIVKIDKERNVDTIQDVVPIIEEKYIDSFTSLDKNIKVSVWSGRRVDYIYGKNIKFTLSDHCKVTYSDHYPIYADFCI